jgi:hypothetical protein
MDKNATSKTIKVQKLNNRTKFCDLDKGFLDITPKNNS